MDRIATNRSREHAGTPYQDKDAPDLPGRLTFMGGEGFEPSTSTV